jgi:hypothetical protein
MHFFHDKNKNSIEMNYLNRTGSYYGDEMNVLHIQAAIGGKNGRPERYRNVFGRNRTGKEHVYAFFGSSDVIGK